MGLKIICTYSLSSGKHDTLQITTALIEGEKKKEEKHKKFLTEKEMKYQWNLCRKYFHRQNKVEMKNVLSSCAHVTKKKKKEKIQVEVEQSERDVINNS